MRTFLWLSYDGIIYESTYIFNIEVSNFAANIIAEWNTNW
jgi:hypothetical protein